MTKAYLLCAVVTCMVCLASSVLNSPCNDGHTDCDGTECCAHSSSLAGNPGFKGVCKTSLRVGDECTPGHLAEGQCHCSHGMSCVKTDPNGINKCYYLPQ